MPKAELKPGYLLLHLAWGLSLLLQEKVKPARRDLLLTDLCWLLRILFSSCLRPVCRVISSCFSMRQAKIFSLTSPFPLLYLKVDSYCALF